MCFGDICKWCWNLYVDDVDVAKKVTREQIHQLYKKAWPEMEMIHENFDKLQIPLAGSQAEKGASGILYARDWISSMAVVK